MGSNKPNQSIKSIALMSTIISYLVGPVLVGILFGRWLDSLMGVQPLFLIIGLFLGLGSGIYGLVRLLSKYLGEDDS